MGRHGGRADRRQPAQTSPAGGVSSRERDRGGADGVAAADPDGLERRRPATALLTPPGGVRVDAHRVVGLNTPAGGLPDPERWWNSREYVPTAPAPVTGPPMPTIWWDEAPVPPPVVVAAADPGLVDDPQDVTAIFLVPGTRPGPVPGGGPHPAWSGDAAEAGGETLGGVVSPPVRRRLSTDSGSELVRPYVTGPIPLSVWAEVDPGQEAAPATVCAPIPPPAEHLGARGIASSAGVQRRRARRRDRSESLPAGPVNPLDERLEKAEALEAALTDQALVDRASADPAPTSRSAPQRGTLSRRARQDRELLGTHLTPPTGLTGLLGAATGASPVSPAADDGPREAAETVSLFEPITRAEAGCLPDGPWAAPAGGLPSRKELRAGRRQTDSTRGVAARRLAKGGVLAVTAFGVVAVSAPAAVTAMGVDLNGSGSGGLPNAAMNDASSAQSAMASVVLAERVAAAKIQASVQEAYERKQKDAADAAVAAKAASAAGRTLAETAAEQVRQEAARKAAIAERISRNVIRDPKAYAQMLVQERGWSSSQFTCLKLLWNRESGWNYRAQNPSSGAYGIPQALPGSKMGTVASDWRTNPATQIKWGLNYIAGRYGTPCAAWAHSEDVGWY